MTLKQDQGHLGEEDGPCFEPGSGDWQVQRPAEAPLPFSLGPEPGVHGLRSGAPPVLHLFLVLFPNPHPGTAGLGGAVSSTGRRKGPPSPSAPLLGLLGLGGSLPGEGLRKRCGPWEMGDSSGLPAPLRRRD